MSTIAINEYSLSVDDFNNPKVYKDAEAVMVLLMRLLLLDPGTIQSHPDMGVGLVSRYRYSMEGEEAQLQSEYRNQIDRYLPQYQGANVQVEFRNYMFYISVTIEGMLFAIMYDINNESVNSMYSRLNDLQ